jgi:thiol-disulfide isomerase/thioredoxin
MRQRMAFRTILLVPFLLGSAVACEGSNIALKNETTPGSATEYRGMDGAVHTLAQLKGHAIVVNLWATWCSPCREEMPRLQKLADSYAPKGVTFIAISLDEKETQGKIEATVMKRGFRIPVWTGGSEKTLEELGLGKLLPATLILDENGIAIGKIEGEARMKDVSSRLDWLLDGRQGKQPKLVQKNDW